MNSYVQIKRTYGTENAMSPALTLTHTSRRIKLTI